MEKSLFIKTLLFAGKHPNGFTYEELQAHLNVTEFGILSDELNGRGSDSAFHSISSRGETKFWLTKSGHKLLYEIEQVRNANKEATKARKLAWISILIAALIPIATLCIDRFWPQENILDEGQFQIMLDQLQQKPTETGAVISQ